MDSNSDMPKRQLDGGTEQDLKDAENAMVAAGDPALALAMRRHTEAIRNYMQTTLVPSFEKAIGTLLDKKLGEVTQHSDTARDTRNAQLQDHFDHRFDTFGAGLTTVVGLVQEVQASQAMFQVGVDERLTAFDARMTASEADRTELRDRLTRLEAVNDRLTKVESYIAGSRRDEIGKLRAEIDALKQARGDGNG